MASRPLDFRVTLPSAASRVDFLLALVKKAPKGCIRSFQHQDVCSFELRVTSLQGASALKGLASVEVDGVTVPLVSLETNLTVVTVSKAPVAMDDAHIVAALAQYGTVKDIKRETYEHPELNSIETGNRRVIMEMKSPVPNFIRIRGKRIIFRYPGMRRVCFRCGQTGHFKKSCPAPACPRCGDVGHASCARPCRRCGGDHPSSCCSVETWASRVAAVPNGSGTGVAGSLPLVSEPDVAPVAGTVGAAELSAGDEPLPHGTVLRVPEGAQLDEAASVAVSEEVEVVRAEAEPSAVLVPLPSDSSEDGDSRRGGCTDVAANAPLRDGSPAVVNDGVVEGTVDRWFPSDVSFSGDDDSVGLEDVEMDRDPDGDP